MPSQFGNVNQGSASHKLLGNKSMAQIVDLGVLDAGKHKETIDAASNVSNKKGVAGFGDKDVFSAALWSFDKIAFQGGFGGGIERNLAGGMRLVGTNDNFVVSEIEIGSGEVGQFGDAHTGLKEKFDDSGNTAIGTAGVTKGAVLEFT